MKSILSIWLCSIMAVLPVSAQLTTPGLFKHLKGQKAKGLQAKVSMSARQIGIALFTFSNDEGRLPGEKTVKAITGAAADGVKIAAESANDCFFQLMVGGYLDNPAVFSPERGDHPRRDKEGLKKLEHCFFSYIPSNGFDRADRPLVVAPLIKGKKSFDPTVLNGKAVVLLSDLSVHLLAIDEQGRVMLHKKDLFDPKQAYWMGKEPTVKWPD